MRERLEQIDLDVQYSKAAFAFEYCITNEANEFLNEPSATLSAIVDGI